MESLHHKALQGLHFPSSPEAKTPCSQCRGAWVQSLVRELDLICHNWRSYMPQWGWKIPCAATKTQSSQINIYIYIYIYIYIFFLRNGKVVQIPWSWRFQNNLESETNLALKCTKHHVPWQESNWSHQPAHTTSVKSKVFYWETTVCRSLVEISISRNLARKDNPFPLFILYIRRSYLFQVL